MPFPFSIIYTARLAGKYASINNIEALELIAAFIEEKTGDDIVIEIGVEEPVAAGIEPYGERLNGGDDGNKYVGDQGRVPGKYK